MLTPLSIAVLVFSSDSFLTNQKVRMLLFDKIYLTGVAMRLAYRGSDFDGDGFTSLWPGENDSDNLDYQRNVLSTVELKPRTRDAGRAVKNRKDGSGAGRFNILLITADTLGADQLVLLRVSSKDITRD